MADNRYCSIDLGNPPNAMESKVAEDFFEQFAYLSSDTKIQLVKELFTYLTAADLKKVQNLIIHTKRKENKCWLDLLNPRQKDSRQPLPIVSNGLELTIPTDHELVDSGENGNTVTVYDTDRYAIGRRKAKVIIVSVNTFADGLEEESNGNRNDVDVIISTFSSLGYDCSLFKNEQCTTANLYSQLHDCKYSVSWC